MEEELRTHILTCADEYHRATGISMTSISRMSSGNTRFFQLLQDGEAAFSVRIYDRTMAWFSNAWPIGRDWPQNIPRPVNVDLERIAPRKRGPYQKMAEQAEAVAE
ncbi:hypothetical protein ACRC7T_06415 [Segnochrobactraceae bacterium EtOH-i3]